MKKYIFILFFISCSNNSNKAEQHANTTASNIVQTNQDIPKATESEPCQKEMIHVVGNYCTKIKEHCIKWIDDPSLNYARCKSYAKSECIGPKKQMDYCIDKYEAHDEKMMPITNISWKESREICISQNKDLCTEDEWTFAAVGEENKPYVYGYDRYPSPCYIEQPKNLAVCGKELCDIRKPVDAFPNCKSDFGVINQNGGVDEFIIVPRYQHSKIQGISMRSALKGGHAWHNARSRNLPITKDHDENFKMISIGFRCCSNSNIK